MVDDEGALRLLHEANIKGNVVRVSNEQRGEVRRPYNIHQDRVRPQSDTEEVEHASESDMAAHNV